MNSTRVSLSDEGFADASSSRKLPIWPAASIVVLLVFAIVLPPGLITVLNCALLFLAMIVWLTSREALPRPFWEIVLPFFAICTVGLLSGIGSDLYVYLKDAWYVANAGLIIAVGFVLYRAKPDGARGLRAFAIGGTIVGCIYLIPFIRDPSLLELQATQSRDLAGDGHFAPALALLIMLAGWKDPLSSLCMPRWLVSTSLLICTVAIACSFSRTIVLTTVLGVLSISGFFTGRVWAKVAVGALVCVAALSVVRFTVDLESSDARHSFVGKLARSLDELNIKEYADFKNVNERYRGYEAARALHAYEAGTPGQWVVGQGFGELLDLNVFVPGIGRYIPILHNGYFYLLLKGGLLSVALFLFSLWKMYALGFRHRSTYRPTGTIIGRLMQAVALGLFLTTWVIAGVFNKLDMFPFLLCAGFLCGHLTQFDETDTAASS